MYEEIIKSKESIFIEEGFEKGTEQEKYERIVREMKEATVIAISIRKSTRKSIVKQKKKEKKYMEARNVSKKKKKKFSHVVG